jgi:hypothetical protein
MRKLVIIGVVALGFWVASQAASFVEQGQAAMKNAKGGLAGVYTHGSLNDKG